MATLLVNDLNPRVQYTATSSQTVFAYGFSIFNDSDLKVYVGSTVKTLTTDYTVSGAGTTAGGNVTFGTGLTSGDIVTIYRDLPVSRTTDYQANGDLLAESLNDDLDKLAMMIQQVEYDLNSRTLRFGQFTTGIPLSEFTENATDRAGKVLAFDSSGDPNITQELGTYQGTDATTTTAAYSIRDIVKSTTTAQLNNIYICTATSPSGTALTNTSYWALIIDAVAAGSSATAAASSATAAASSATAAATSATSAATSATTATTQATTATTQATTATTQASAASSSASAAATSETNAAASYDAFDDRYLGSKSSDPTVDNDGATLLDGAMYFNTTNNVTMVYDLGGTSWGRTIPTAADQTNIDTVSGISANVTTVAGVSANVTTVAGIAANVTTVAGDAADIATVAADGTDIGTVAGISANVTTVAGISANVTTVAGISSDVTTVATNESSVNRYSDEYTIAATAPSSPNEGDLWADTSSNVLKHYNGSSWSAVTSVAGMSDVVDDTTPQLGGNLDMQAHSIEGVTATEMGYLDGVTSDIQTQLDTKLSSVADNSVTLAKMAGGTDGNLITYDASGDPAYVTTGTSGQVLTSGGTGVAPTFQTAAGGGKVLQVVSANGRTTDWSTTSSSPVQMTDTSITITPTSISSRIWITWQVTTHQTAVGTANVGAFHAHRGSTDLGAIYGTRNGHSGGGTTYIDKTTQCSVIDHPNTVSATTYSLYGKAVVGTFYGQRSFLSSTTPRVRMVALEIETSTEWTS